MNRIKEKIEEIEKFIEELYEIVPDNLEEYIANKEKKAACERYFEKIIEAVTDLAFYTIKIKKLETPQDDEGAFEILKENKIIDETLSKKSKEAKGMRNIIIHQYGKIDDEKVFNAISEGLKKDVEEFIKNIKKQFKETKKK